MKKVSVTILNLGFIVFGLMMWAPWITKGFAENRAAAVFQEQQEGVIDGCGFECEGCGVKGSYRTFFGYSVALEYACGLLPSDSPLYHTRSEMFISAFGTVSEK